MAEFRTGDRIVKMSGTGAGRYGIVNSVGENGTLNVTFDGERLPRFCDPERCGLIATNAKFKIGDKVKYVGRKNGAPYGKTLTVVREPDNLGRYIVRWESDHSGFMAVGSEGFVSENEIVAANSRARNSIFKVG